MYRGQVSAVDGAGVYVLVPALHPTAPFGPLEHVGATPAVGARVLVVDCGGESEPDLVVLTGGFPATSTDNAVARFDGTAGALQNSGVTIDDEGHTTFAHDIYITRPSASSQVHVTGASGQWSSLVLHGGESAIERWVLTKNVTPESGANAGSDLQLYRYTDGGSGTPTLEVNRATGKVTFRDVGPTAGIEMGGSGPTITTGTGAPSHSAANGSIYLRTDGTASTTLYVRAGGAWSALS